MTTPRGSTEKTSGPLGALSLPLVAFLIIAVTGCESVGECVQQYQFEGIVRKDGYTRAECEEECAQIGRTLSCVWEGGVMAPPVIVSRGEAEGQRAAATSTV